MAEDFEIADVAEDISLGSRAIASLARDSRQFEAAVKAFRGRDFEAWHKVLIKADLLIHCHRVCQWFVSKECVRICILLAGPPREPVTVEQIGPFTEVLTRLVKQPKLIETLAKAIEAEDRRAFQAVVAELKAQHVVHLLCHWVCFVRYHLVCRTLCHRIKWNPRDLIAQLRTSALAVASVASKPDQLKRIVAGAAKLDCIALKEIFGRHQDCRLICFWLCSWRCLVVCLRLTHRFPLAGDYSVGEMQAFAKYCAELRDPATANTLAAAVARQDEGAFAEFVKRHKAERFVHQLCHWVCYLVCHRLCICICPPPGVIPLFTHVGQYRVDPFYGDFAADGTTTAGRLAFTATIPLLGLLPDSPAGDPVEYRFTVENLAGGGAQPLTADEIQGTTIGQLQFWEWDPAALPAPGQWVLRVAGYTINNAPQFRDIQQDVGPPLTVQISTPIAADGWIRIPSDNNLIIHGTGRFVPTNTLASLDTTKLTFEPFNLIGPGAGLPVIAGTTVPGPMRSVKPVYRIVFEARKAVGLAAIHSNTLPRIALSNTQYTYNYHPDWAGSPPLPPRISPVVVSLDIAELIGHGCDPLSSSSDVHALFTAYHPYLATCSVSIEGPAPLPPAVAPAIAGGEALSPAGGQSFATSGLQPCAYILWLDTTLNLTTGYGAIGTTHSDHIAFCIH
ncbi:MAG TPA: hypothetical protein VE053_16710 [Allosphingosinicella sp.]|nr:hypothetical protein [Allosphingosinicella sp.]